MAADTLLDRWERSETDSGIPYYLNHTDGTTQWEHPNLSFLLSRGFDEINLYKYSAYRTAVKLREIQKETQLCNVNLRTLELAFRELGYGRDQTNEVMRVVEVESVLSKIFHNASENKLGGYNFSLLPQWVSDKVTSQHNKCGLEPETHAEITLNWILKCYDSGRTGLVKVHSLKVGLVALCHATIQEKYSFLFDMMNSGQNQIAFSKLKTLIQDLLQLPHNVGEGGAFSVDRVADTANSCWTHAGKKVRECVGREEFWQWVKKEPVSLVWFPTLYRLATSETVKHEAKCHECKAFPIVGIRYRCLKCTNVDLCQVCYWKQINTVKNHKMTHPIREYCLATTSGDDIRDFAKQIKNKITRKYRNKPPKRMYLDYDTTVDDGDDEDQATGISPAFQNAHTRIGHMAERLLVLEGGMNRSIGEGSLAVVEEPDYEPVRIPDDVDERQRAEEMTRIEAEARQRAEEMTRIEAEARQRVEETTRIEVEVRQRAEEMIRIEAETRQRAEERVKIEAEIRQKAEETTRIEAEARRLAESQKQMTERQMVELQDKNQQLESELERLAHKLQQKPKEIRVPIVLPPPPKASSPALVDSEIQADLTTSSETRSPQEWTTSFVGDQQELDSIFKDLLRAFPTPTTEVFATDLCHELFIAVAVIGNSLDTLVKEVASTQSVS